MKRDLDLVRRILVTLEETPAGDPPTYPDYDDLDAQIVTEHLALMLDAGLIEGKMLRANGALHSVGIARMTNAGHDFLCHARSSGLWDQMKAEAVKRGLGLTVDLAAQMLVRLAASAAS